MSEPFIVCDKVCFSYGERQDAKTVLKDVSLEINRGELVAVLGHNGSGKSTLAKMLNAVLVPKSGSVTVDGIDSRDEQNLFELRRRVGMVFQNPDNQIVATVVEEDVAFAPENLGVAPDEIRKRVDDALKTVGMYERRKDQPHKLSGGQKQRVAIAGVLAMNSDCIVLDEPTAMLDPKGREQVMETVLKLNREGKTIVLITHFMDEAARCNRVIVMNDGSVCMDAPPRQVFSRADELKKMGLAVPEVTELCRLLGKSGFDISPDIISREECISELLRLFKS